MEELRKVKDAGEVDRMAEAARIADEALARVRHRLAEGPTEEEFALELDFEMRRGGASGPSFETIVASGPNGAKPHHRPSGRRIEHGELVVVDFGAVVDGYCSDMTRTLCVGEPASATARRMVDVVAESQRAGVEAVRAGAEGKAVDEACRAIIAEAGWADAFLHSTGHGVGLEIHEDPRVASTSTDTLVAGHVVTVEPGVYLPEHGGVRIEDTMVVTDEGCLVLTNATRSLRFCERPGSRSGQQSGAHNRESVGHERLDQRPAQRHGPRSARGAVHRGRVQHVKPGKGRRLRTHQAEEVRTGAVLDRTYRPTRSWSRPSSTSGRCSTSTRERPLRVHGQRVLRPAQRRRPPPR